MNKIQPRLTYMMEGRIDGCFVTLLCAFRKQEAILFIIPLILTPKALKSPSLLVRAPG